MYTTYNLAELDTREANFYQRLRQAAIDTTAEPGELFAVSLIERLFDESPQDLVQKALLGFQASDTKRVRVGRYEKNRGLDFGIDVFFSDSYPTLFNYPWLRITFREDNPQYVTLRAGTGIGIINDGTLFGVRENSKRLEKHPRFMDLLNIVNSYPHQEPHMEVGPSNMPIIEGDMVTWQDVRIEVIPATAFPYVWGNLSRV